MSTARVLARVDRGATSSCRRNRRCARAEPPVHVASTYAGGVARLLEQAAAIEHRVWPRPAESDGDVLLRAEIVLRNENGLMASLQNPEADHDERATAELAQAIVGVLGNRSSVVQFSPGAWPELDSERK